MVSNFNLCLSWIQLAREDFCTAVDAIHSQRRGPAVFHIQQCAEKLCKAILAYFGQEPRKTHFPSGEIRELAAKIESDRSRHSESGDEEGTEVLDDDRENGVEEESLEAPTSEDEDLEQEDAIVEILSTITLLTRSIEDEGTRPRYGIRHTNGITLPEKIYSEEDVALFFHDLETIVQKTKELLETRDAVVNLPLLEELNKFKEDAC